MITLSSLASALGIALVLLGTVVLALPDLPRSLRIPYYRNSRLLHSYYEAREEVLAARRGHRFTFCDWVICYTFVDFLDKKLREDVPDRRPKKIRTGTVKLEAEVAGDWNQYDFQHPQKAIVELLDMTLARECRMIGISIALTGTLIAIAGTLM